MKQLNSMWAAHQLADFLSVVSGQPDEPAAHAAAVERAAEAFEAEVAAIISEGRPQSLVGIADAPPHHAALLAVASGKATLDVPGVGDCAVAVHDHDGVVQLLVARRGDEPFTPEERGLLRSMTRVLSLTLKNFRLLEALRNRQELFERLTAIQRSISHRAGLAEILDSIAIGLSELFDDDLTMIRLIDVDDPTHHVLAASHGLPDTAIDGLRRLPISVGPGGRVIREGALVVIDDLPHSPDAVSALVTMGIVTVMATPIHIGGNLVGAILIGSRDPTRQYGATEQEALLAFAEHASIALTDAEALDGMRRSLHDPLTGLPNRSFFVERLDDALAVHRPSALLAVLFVDLDRFKAINDSLGHAGGDEVLVEVGRRIAGALRPTDIVARLGGDEFTVLIQDAVSRPEIEHVAQRVKDALLVPMRVAGRDLVVSASIGIAFHDHDGDTTDLVHAADVAMYHAKATERGTIQTFQPTFGEQARRRLDVEGALRAALDAGDLHLHYQPIVDLRHEARVVGVEALLRCDRVDLQQESIAHLVTVAEETGLVHRLGAWAIDAACRQLRAWSGDCATPPIAAALHVNVSGHQLRDPAFVDVVAAALARHRLPAAGLTLELTESVWIGNDADSLEALRRLRGLGVRLSLDDFGKGYSSLAYIAEMDIQSLKIDQRFVGRLGTHGADTVIRHVTAMAQQLGMTVIAEGVETAAQRRRLTELGCDLAQGYLFGRAADATAIGSMLTGGERSPELPALSSTV